MPEGVVTNPTGAYRGVTDFTTWVDGNGADIEYERTVMTFRANATILAHDAVMFVAPTTANPLSVAQFAVTDTIVVGNSFAGCALNGAVAGDKCQVIVRGFARIQVGTATPAAYDVAKRAGSAAGAVGVLASGTEAATDIIGTAFGIFLGVDDASNFAPIMLGRF